MITLDSVTQVYGDVIAVDHVSFTALPGRVTGFLGPNGAGKSTTMRVVVGLTRATSGGATVLGRRYVDLPNPGSRSACSSTRPPSTRAGRAGRPSPSPSGSWVCRRVASTRCSTWSA